MRLINWGNQGISYQHRLTYLLNFLTVANLARVTIALPTSTTDSSDGIGLSTHLTERQQSKYQGGTRVVNGGGCDAAGLQTMSNAIFQAGLLAQAGLNAAANFSAPPFSFFFKPDPATANKVASVLTAALNSANGNGDLTAVSCVDTVVTPNYCAIHTDNAAYVATSNGLHFPTIVVCPDSMGWPLNGVPCQPTVKPGVISIGWLMLHEMVHVADPAIGDAEGYSARAVRVNLLKGIDSTKDANAYAYLGSFAWDLGLGGPPYVLRRCVLHTLGKQA